MTKFPVSGCCQCGAVRYTLHALAKGVVLALILLYPIVPYGPLADLRLLGSASGAS